MVERPPVLLAAGGVDPSGGAGLAADARAGQAAGVFVRTVATALTVQGSTRVSRVVPLDPMLVEEQTAAALADGVDIAKVGLVPDAAVGRALLRALPPGLPLVVDPILGATAPGALVQEDARDALLPLLARAALVTPNLREARALTGLEDAEEAAWALHKEGARNVLVTGGDAPTEDVQDLLLTAEGEIVRHRGARHPVGSTRGTGCTLATLAAAHLAQGYDARDAVEAAIAETRGALAGAFAQPGARAFRPAGSSLLPDARPHPPEVRARIAAVARAWRSLATELPRKLVPEVGSNMSYLGPDGDPEKAAVLSARCVRAGRGVRLAGAVEVGGVHHTGRIAAAAWRADPSVRVAMNLKHETRLAEAARAVGLHVGSFSRADQPADASSSVEWGTSQCIRREGGVPDVIYDEGGPGKEPILRVLGRDPQDVERKVRALVAAWSLSARDGPA